MSKGWAGIWVPDRLTVGQMAIVRTRQRAAFHCAGKSVRLKYGQYEKNKAHPHEGEQETQHGVGIKVEKIHSIIPRPHAKTLARNSLRPMFKNRSTDRGSCFFFPVRSLPPCVPPVESLSYRQSLPRKVSSGEGSSLLSGCQKRSARQPRRPFYCWPLRKAKR